LRKFADLLSISPTYLSKIERGEFKPPSEEKIKVMATLLEEDPDELLALAGRVASDLPEIVQKNPKDMADFLRAVDALPKKDFQRLLRKVQRAVDNSRGRKK
jgi:transcriptional regulator with XRE-family HTH domain